MQEVMHDIDIKLLKIFLIVAKEQSFSLAAEQLNISPSKISMSMTQLESRLGMRLCERGVRGFKLTDQGKQIIDASGELFNSIKNFRDQANFVARGINCEYRIGVLTETMSDGHMRLPAILSDLETMTPGISFQLTFESAEALKEKVVEGTLHCALGYFTELDSSLQSRYLYTERHSCYCANTHPLFNSAANDITSEALKKCRIAGYDDLGEKETTVAPLFAKFDSCSRSAEGILALILTGNYIGLMHESFARNWVDKGILRIINNKELGFFNDINVIYQSTRAKEPTLKSILTSVNKVYPVRKNPTKK